MCFHPMRWILVKLRNEVEICRITIIVIIVTKMQQTKNAFGMLFLKIFIKSNQDFLHADIRPHFFIPIGKVRDPGYYLITHLTV